MGAENSCTWLHRKPKSVKESKQDFYQTDYRYTLALMDFLNELYCGETDIKVLDPCFGKGAISNILKTRYNNVTEIDLFDENNPTDFLTHEEKYDLIVANPPFSKKMEFIDHALEIGTNVFMLLPGLSENYNIIGEYKRKPEYKGKINLYPKMKLDRVLDKGKGVRGGTSNYQWIWFNSETEEDVVSWYKNAASEFSVDVTIYDKKLEEYLTKVEK